MKRKTEFDIVRILAILMIFNYHFCNELVLKESILYGYKNGGWGSVGTCIFFVLSGYLIHMTSKNVDIKTYFKKRFLSIYPALWISFILAYIFLSIQKQSMLWGGHGLKLLLSFLGIDTYVSLYGVLTYACVGEWFTGMILFIYCLYPLFRVLMKKLPLLSTIIIAGLYFAESFYGIQPVVPPDSSVFTAMFLFWIGMLFQEHGTWLKPGALKILLALVSCYLVIFVKLPVYGNVLPWKNLLGLALFYLMLNIFSLIPYGDSASKALKYFSGISFAIYLVHHFVIFRVIELMPNAETIMCYLISLVITIICAILINHLSHKLITWRS
ncbi:acyltransferase family protein [Pseudobutyrivibrio sp. MD2005]|uniref:acyltransferase family protein n=1 Tax=Pseudobutyrivibrio sp. MD2005 TaxID=1410616 RepID=UPI000489E6BD|nr:acyltransferase [Pseudobutyrivibrio sp. MD2005]